MCNHFLRTITLGALTSVTLSGCLLSSAVDRTYLGFNEATPKYADRKMAGLALLPFATAMDILFLPVEALVVIFEGDNFPVQKKNPAGSNVPVQQYNPAGSSIPAQQYNKDPRSAIESNAEFARLADEKKAVARVEFENLMRTGLSANNAYVLCADGHWLALPLSAEARATLLARTQRASLAEIALRSAN